MAFYRVPTVFMVEILCTLTVLSLRVHGDHSACAALSRYASVTRAFVDRSLSITCSVHMRSLRARRSSPHLRQLPPPDKQFLHIFCPFGVRYLYPFVCDSINR